MARIEAEKEGIVVPLTLEDYCIKTQVKSTTQEPQVSTSSYYTYFITMRAPRVFILYT